MATLTATAAASAVEPRNIHAGLQSVSVEYNSGSTAISDSATTVLMCKVPNGATIVDVIEYHTTGAATCPVDVGVQGALAAFNSAGTQGTANHASTGIPYKVSLSDDATNQFVYVTATPTAGTTTASFKCNLTVMYCMDDQNVA